MRYLSQTKAAKLAGVSRGTIASRIKEGVLSCTPDGIDPAELSRVFPVDADRIDRYLSTGDLPDEMADTDNRPGNDRASPAHSTGDASAIAAHADWLQGLVDEQRATIERKDRELHEAVERAERQEAVWSSRLDKVTALLPAPAEPTPDTRGFWGRMLNKSPG